MDREIIRRILGAKDTKEEMVLTAKEGQALRELKRDYNLDTEVTTIKTIHFTPGYKHLTWQFHTDKSVWYYSHFPEGLEGPETERKEFGSLLEVIYWIRSYVPRD